LQIKELRVGAFGLSQPMEEVMEQQKVIVEMLDR